MTCATECGRLVLQATLPSVLPHLFFRPHADHNMVLALQWLESQRAVMYDPSYSGYFVQVCRLRASRHVASTAEYPSAWRLPPPVSI
jgi:hypothetical protein